MRITYRDVLGYSEIKVDDYNIGFVNDFAYFSSEGNDYKIPVSDIVCISILED